MEIVLLFKIGAKIGQIGQKNWGSKIQFNKNAVKKLLANILLLLFIHSFSIWDGYE